VDSATARYVLGRFVDAWGFSHVEWLVSATIGREGFSDDASAYAH
jgi:hypothetical protein